MKYLLLIMILMSAGTQRLWAMTNKDKNIFIYQKEKLHVSKYVELNCTLYTKKEQCISYQFVAVVDDSLHITKDLIGSSFNHEDREQVIQNYIVMVKSQLRSESDIFVSATYGLLSHAFDYPVFLPFAFIAGSIADIFKLPYSVGEYFSVLIPMRKTVRRFKQWRKQGQLKATKMSAGYYDTVIDFLIYATKQRSNK